MEENILTIKILRDFLISLPSDFDNFGVVNGEVGGLDGQYFYRIDKPVIQLTVDEETKELVVLHQTREEINTIKAPIENGNTEKS